jgi:hypothetical protein
LTDSGAKVGAWLVMVQVSTFHVDPERTRVNVAIVGTVIISSCRVLVLKTGIDAVAVNLATKRGANLE